MALFNFDVTYEGRTVAVELSGTQPFAKHQTGGESGAVSVVDATGAFADVMLNGETASTVFAESGHAQAFLDTIVTAANAAIPPA